MGLVLGFIGGFSTHGILSVIMGPKEPWYKASNHRYTDSDCFVEYHNSSTELSSKLKVLSVGKDYYLVAYADFIEGSKIAGWAVHNRSIEYVDNNTYRVDCWNEFTGN